MKKMLFVINTLGTAGAENALLELLNSLNRPEYEISLYVLTGQGELVQKLPKDVRLLNTSFNAHSVLSKEGRNDLRKTVLRAFFRNGHMGRKVVEMLRNFMSMYRSGKILADKILWRMMAEGAERFEETYDLAVAYLEGGSTYYVADYVHAKKKAAFVHIDYESSGYTKEMDRDCYEKMDRIFTVSAESKKHFLKVYPQYREKTKVFHNIINQERIRLEAEKEGGFPDTYDGIRLLTVGRLTYQKGYDIAIDAMSILKQKGVRARWYILGEGNERAALEKKIANLGLEEEFLLIGAVENPLTWYAQTDIYVHATRFEGKSIAIQEAQTLGCAILASDCNGNREQIIPDVDGVLCELTPEKIAFSILDLIEDEGKRKRLREAAAKKSIVHEEELQQLTELLD